MSPQEILSRTYYDGYVHALRLWSKIHRCFPKTLSKEEMEDISVQFCGYRLRAAGFSHHDLVPHDVI